MLKSIADCFDKQQDVIARYAPEIILGPLAGAKAKL
jgi:hypothetical protein